MRVFGPNAHEMRTGRGANRQSISAAAQYLAGRRQRVVRERVGRRNVYKVKPELPLHHPLTQETEQRRIGDLLEVLLGEDGRGDGNASGLSSHPSAHLGVGPA
jgi:hypothetical protein